MSDNIHCTIMRKMNVLRQMVESEDPDKYFHGRWKTRAGDKTNGLVYAKGFIYGGSPDYGYEAIWDSDQELLILLEDFLLLIEKALTKKGIKMPEEKTKPHPSQLGWTFDENVPIDEVHMKTKGSTVKVKLPLAGVALDLDAVKPHVNMGVKDLDFSSRPTAEARISALVYDCEIKKSPLPRNPDDLVQGIEYCKNWDDLENMGIACICAYDYLTDRYRVFMDDNIAAFQRLVLERQFLVGYNSDRFDNLLLEANGVSLGWTPSESEKQKGLFSEHERVKSYDILREIWVSMNLDPTIFNPKTHSGTGLDAVAKINLGRGKIGNGAAAAVLWQQGRRGEIVNYCMDDVQLTKGLFDLILQNGTLKNPRKTAGSSILKLRKPEDI